MKCDVKRGCRASQALHLWMLVRGIVVRDQMEVEVRGRLAIDLLQETQPFDVSVARLGARDQLPFI